MLLDFPGGVKCSYSPSMCEENDFSKYKDEIYKVHEAIKDFKYVGVRESNAKRMIELFGKDKPIEVVLDPVFLFDMKEWIKLLEIETTEEGYVLVYCLGLLSDEIIECIQKISVNKKVFFVVVNRLNECHKEWNKVVNVDPIDFVRLVYGADYIVCDSFHMVAFSIIFRKQFSVFTCHRREFKSNMDRITNLLERVHLEKRFDNAFSVDEYIDYSQYNDCIEEEIKKSKDFLSNLVGAFK